MQFPTMTEMDGIANKMGEQVQVIRDCADYEDYDEDDSSLSDIVTPWIVMGSTDYGVDYDRLISKPGPSFRFFRKLIYVYFSQGYLVVKGFHRKWWQDWKKRSDSQRIHF